MDRFVNCNSLRNQDLYTLCWKDAERACFKFPGAKEAAAKRQKTRCAVAPASSSFNTNLLIGGIDGRTKRLVNLRHSTNRKYNRGNSERRRARFVQASETQEAANNCKAAARWSSRTIQYKFADRRNRYAGATKMDLKL